MCDWMVILLWQTIVSQSLHISSVLFTSRLLKHRNMNIYRHLKEHYVVLGKTFQSGQYLDKLNKQPLFGFMTEQTNWHQRTTQFYNFLLCLYFVDRATFLAKQCPGDPDNSLFIQFWKKNIFYYHFINIINISIPSLNFFSINAPLYQKWMHKWQ